MIYNQQFYNGIKEGSNSSADIIVPIVIDSIKDKINSIVDFGCGTGAFLGKFKQYLSECEIKGLDFGNVSSNLVIDENEFTSVDLSKPYSLDKKYDLCISLEVAEHIHEEFADILIENLCNASDIILFSAALPKQGGGRHVNEQHITYWAEKFKARDYIQCDFIRKQIWNEKSVEYWYKQNIAMYVKKDMIDMIQYKEKDSFEGMEICHPDALYTAVSDYEKNLINLKWFKNHLPNLYKLYIKLRA